MKITVIQTAFLGDIVLSFYFLQTLKNLYPEAEITFITNPAVASLLPSIKCIDKSIIYDKRKSQKGLKSIKELAESINSLGRADMLFCLHRSLRSSILSKHLNAEVKVGYRNSVINSIYNHKADYYFNLHEVERNQELIKQIDKNASIADTVAYEFDKHTFDKVDTMIEQIEHNRFILLAPGSVWKTKQWLPERFRDLAYKLVDNNFSVGLIGSEKETELCNSIAKKKGIINFSGRTNLSETLYLMTKANALVTNDSAPIHIAGIAGLRTIAIFGPTSPIFGFYPRGINDSVIQNEEIKCRPCLIHGSHKCPIGTFECMHSITTKMVLEKIIK